MKLLRLTSSNDGFRRVELRDALNVVLADRAESAASTDSRNGLGKTTLIALIDYCLGGQPGERIQQMEGRAWTFTLEVRTRAGIQLFITRGVDDPSSIVLKGDLLAAGIASIDNSQETPVRHLILGNGAWTNWLQKEVFPTVLQAGDFKSPTFRSLIRHFIRYRLDAFLKPFATMGNPRAIQTQSENAYLLNLDWRLATEWQELNNRKKQILAVDDPDESVEQAIGSLQSQMIRRQRQADALAEEISSFSVLPEYRNLEAQIDDWSARIKALTNDNIADRKIMSAYAHRQREEFSSSSFDVQELFAEAGVALADSIVRSLDDAAAFHAAVISNRAAYLDAELRRLQNRVAEREEQQHALSTQQSTALQLLRSGGALEDFAVMQQKLGTAQATVAEIDGRIRMLRELRDRKAKVRADELNLITRTTADLDERLDRRAGIIFRFGQILEQMYGEPADLEVVLGRTGLQFRTRLPRAGSSGVEKMAIFAYDLAITEDLSQQGRGPGFLIHDSTMFDGVDERQVAQAISIAAESSSELGFQYLIALNSDVVPTAELGDVEAFEASVILTLSDADESGGLLGIRLHSPNPEENALTEEPDEAESS
jgi:uncharacterized protein YydD (DUF2326 family)